ncbi:MAG: efflux RND transporter periplasmic adaptor subunit [Prevotellaceae bacterium]|jgi:membrane fusion protein (multidrug efflux system)|nr:efflux RND transporter periplasmic adaptor subunit [Prevotellaceae bacterium]
MKKRILSVTTYCLVFAALIVGGYYIYTRFVSPPPKMNDRAVANPGGGRGGAGGRALPVSVYIARQSSIYDDGRLTLGSLLANEVVELACQTSGKVVLINFEEGQWVDKGVLLVKIDDLDLQAQLTRAEHQFSLASEKLERQRILFDKDAVSREAFDQAQTDNNLILADIELLKVRIDRTEIRAPFRGVIGFRTISLGSYVQAGTRVATLSDIATLKLEFSISERNVFRELVGATARFNVSGSEKEYSSKVYAVDPNLETKTRSLILRALFDNRDGVLRPGMAATRIAIEAERASTVLLVPSEALVSDVGGRSVWKVRNGRAVQTAVLTGNRTSADVEILEGVSPGDTIITSGLLQVREGIMIEAVTF